MLYLSLVIQEKFALTKIWIMDFPKRVHIGMIFLNVCRKPSIVFTIKFYTNLGSLYNESSK